MAAQSRHYVSFEETPGFGRDVPKSAQEAQEVASMASFGVSNNLERLWGGAGLSVRMGDCILNILERCKTLVVVGLSSKPTRASYGVASYMKAHGYRIIPVNPNETSVLGEKAHASLRDVPEPVECVVIFRRSELVPEIVETAIRRGAKVIWMQEGVVNEPAARRARRAGLEVVQDRCILKEHAKRFVTEGI